MRELEALILDAQKVRQDTNENEIYKNEMAKYIGRVNSAINKAIESGISDACFDVHYKYEDDIKKLFKNKGYSFKPTGYIGGVLQSTEKICW